MDSQSFRFLKGGPTKWGYVLILIIFTILVGGGILDYSRYIFEEITSLSQFPEIKIREKVVKEEIANWKTYRNEEYGFEVKYPEKWIVVKEELGLPYSELIKHQVEPLDYRDFYSEDLKQNVTITIYNNSKSYILEEWLRVYKEIIPTEASLSWKEEFSIGGVEGLKGGFGCCMAFRQSAFLSRGNKIYQIAGGVKRF